MDQFPNRSGRVRSLLLAFAILGGISFTALGPVMQNGFVSYDDPDYVTANVHVLKGLNGDSVGWALRTGAAGNWHPLTWISHMADVEFFGLAARKHHFTSLLYHAANAILLFLLLRSLTGCFWPSISAAALFAVHPLHVESVAWVAERKDVLSTFWGLLSLLCYSAYAKRSSPAGSQNQDLNRGSGIAFYIPSFLALAVGLMSKAMLVTWPFVMLLLDFWPLRRFETARDKRQTGRLVLEKLPFALLAASSSIVTYSVQSTGGAVASLDALPLAFRITNAFVSYVRYLGKTIWPRDLAVLYPLPQNFQWPWPVVLAAIALLAVVSATAWRYRKRAPYVAVGWLWYLGTLVPVIGLVQVGQQAIADRYTYIPLIGLFITVSWGVLDLTAFRPGTRRYWSAAAIVTVAVCMILTWHQAQTWQSNETLFAHAVASTSNNAVAHNNLGTSLMERGRLADAESHFQEATRIRPNYAEALTNLGLVREKQERAAEAVDLLQKGIAARPTAVGHYNLANLLDKQGAPAEAEEHFLAALKLKPEFPEAVYNLANVQAKLGRFDAAKASYAKALNMQPTNPDIRMSFGALLAANGKLDAAIEQFGAVLRDFPLNPDAHFNLAAAFEAKGGLAEATPHYREVCRLRPTDRDALQKLGLNLLFQGAGSEAAQQFKSALSLADSQGAGASRATITELAQLNYYLALALHSQGQLIQALPHYREATRLNPNAPLFLNDLAWIMATDTDAGIRNGPEAVRMAERACELSGGMEPRFWGTLDAAYAENGEFDRAITTAMKAKQMAEASGQKEIAGAADERLSNYRERKPHRVPRPAGT